MYKIKVNAIKLENDPKRMIFYYLAWLDVRLGDRVQAECFFQGSIRHLDVKDSDIDKALVDFAQKKILARVSEGVLEVRMGLVEMASLVGVNDE